MHFSLALKGNPKAEQAQRALNLLDAAEGRKRMRDLENEGWNITGRLKALLMSKDAKKPISEIIALCFSSAGPGWSTVAGGATLVLLTAIQASGS